MNIAKRTLASPIVFDAYQSLVGAPRCHKQFIQNMVCPFSGERILDIGCGVGASVRYMPNDVEYVGIDISPAYIARARDNFGSRGQFLCADVTKLDAATLGTFDRGFSFGVLHHLSDAIAAQMVGFVCQVLKPGGTFVTIDPCRVPGQHPIAKLLLDNDRGEYIRSQDGFVKLLSSLGTVRSEVHYDLLRIPYTQLVMWVKLGL